MRAYSRRSSLTDDPDELDRWLREVERELFIRQSADIDSSLTARIKLGNPIPQVTGMTVRNEIVGGIAVQWNPVNHPDLVRYELQISSQSSFSPTTTTTIKVFSTKHILHDITPATPYYVRVRGVGRNEKTGQWSAFINTSTHIATPYNLTVGATKGLVEEDLVDFGYSAYIVNGQTGGWTWFPCPRETTLGGISIQTIGAPVLVSLIVEARLWSRLTQPSGPNSKNNRLNFSLLRNGEEVIDLGVIDFKCGGGIPGASLEDNYFTISTGTTIDYPMPGTYVYSVRYWWTGEYSTPLSDALIWFMRHYMSVLEFRR